MALTGNFAEDEKLMRQGLADLIVDYGSTSLFASDHVHTRPRFVNSNEKWSAIALIPDPDDETKQVMRMASVETNSSDITEREWAIVFDLKVGWGFNDERPENRGNSYDEVTFFAYGLLQAVIEGQLIGVSDRITITRVRHLRTRFVRQDAQGRPAHVADLLVFANVEVC
jgi:hypothetical protein